MDLETLIASYGARAPLYTEHDFVRRFAEIRSARTIGISGIATGRAPDDWMVALLASGRVSDAEYFRLAETLGVDSSGLIHSEPPPRLSLAEQARLVWRAFARLVVALRRD